MSRAPLRVVAVSDDALRSRLLDLLLVHGNPHDVTFVESLAGAYRRIRQLVPDLIVLFMRIDDEGACRLLTMLEVDRGLYGIPVVTWAIGGNEVETDHVIGNPVSADGCAVARV
jgi:hypothetical protein